MEAFWLLTGLGMALALPLVAIAFLAWVVG
jgi:hypothetical protein